MISAGEKMRLTKKKAGMISKKQHCNRDWGKVRKSGEWTGKEGTGQG